MPQAIQLPDGGVLIDFGERVEGTTTASLVHIPGEVAKGIDIPRAVAVATSCGGVEEYTTNKGRSAVRVLEGKGYSLLLRKGNRDASWDNWRARYPSEGFGIAASARSDHAAWWELVVVKKD